MADWNYIAGEDQFNQDFALIDKSEAGGQFDGTDITDVDMTILKSDLSAVSPPIQNVTMSIVKNNPMRLRYQINISTNNMPQTPGSYLAIIRLIDSINGEVRKTFEMDLRVFIGG